MRGWRLAAIGVGVAVLALVAVLVVTANDDDGGDTVATQSRTSTPEVPVDATSTSVSTTVGSTAPAPAPTRVVPTPAPTAGPTSAPSGCARPARGTDFDGFGAAEVVIVDGSGSHRICVLTADTTSQQERGLMRQDDLDGYEGMLFRFATEEELGFWMRNTRIPLSIAFFGAGGGFVSAADMEPCGDRSDCPVYRSAGPAKYALEVLQGRLSAVGATPGSRLTG